MSYRLIYTKSAVKDIKKLDPVVKRRIGKKLELYHHDPLARAKKLTDPSLGTYRWRIGSHRVVFDIVKKHIVILRIRHRRDVYGK